MSVVERGSGGKQHSEWYSAKLRFQDRVNVTDTIYDWTIQVPDTLPTGQLIEFDIKNIWVSGEVQQPAGVIFNNVGEWRLNPGGRPLGWQTTGNSGFTIGYTRKDYDSVITSGINDYFQMNTEVIDHIETISSFSNEWRVTFIAIDPSSTVIPNSFIEDVHIHLVYRIIG